MDPKHLKNTHSDSIFRSERRDREKNLLYYNIKLLKKYSYNNKKKFEPKTHKLIRNNISKFRVFYRNNREKNIIK